jgi:hypothetical protein
MRLSASEHLALAAVMRQRAKLAKDPATKQDYLEKAERFKHLAKLAKHQARHPHMIFRSGEGKFPTPNGSANVISLDCRRQKMDGR